MCFFILALSFFTKEIFQDPTVRMTSFVFYASARIKRGLEFHVQNVWQTVVEGLILRRGIFTGEENMTG